MDTVLARSCQNDVLKNTGPWHHLDIFRIDVTHNSATSIYFSNKKDLLDPDMTVVSNLV